MADKKVVPLTVDEIKTGQIITERATAHLAAFEALKAVEGDYINQLRERYSLGPEYLPLDWMTGFETLPEDAQSVEAAPVDPLVSGVLNDKNN